jgi:uncharacterized FlaG/YvyC family protein
MKTWVKKEPNTYKVIRYSGENPEKEKETIKRWIGDLASVLSGLEVGVAFEIHRGHGRYMPVKVGDNIVLDTATGDIRIYTDEQFHDIFEEL